jgi:replication-associated recombination protein RarA
MTQDLKLKAWYKKYQPKSLEEYVFYNKRLESLVKSWIADGDIPSLLFHGTQGTGKSALMQLLLKELEVEETDILIINASDENSVDDIRNKVKGFLGTWAMGNYKVVVFEEGDYLSNAAQAIMRAVMNDYDHIARFIITCNYPHRLMPALRSRFQQFEFKPSPKEYILEYVLKILLTENVNVTEESITTLEKYIDSYYPDIRTIVNEIQSHVIDNNITPPDQNNATSYKVQLLDLLEAGDWKKIREFCCSNVGSNEWEELYTFLYENIHKCEKFSQLNKWEMAIVTIAEYLDKNQTMSNQELNAAAMFIRLSNL